jgi:hypothetical protein
MALSEMSRLTTLSVICLCWCPLINLQFAVSDLQETKLYLGVQHRKNFFLLCPPEEGNKSQFPKILVFI